MSTDMYSEYPTDQQIEELLDAHRKGGPAAIAEVLRKRRATGTENTTDALESETRILQGAPVAPPLPTEDSDTAKRFRYGTLAFGALSVITLLVAIPEGIPPIFLLEAAICAVAAWFWQRKKMHSEFGKAAATVLAIIIVAGEVGQVASHSDLNSAGAKRSGGNPFDGNPPTQTTAKGSGFNPVDYGATPVSKSNTESPALTCPAGLPAGVTPQPLSASDLPGLSGTDGSLKYSDGSLDSYFKLTNATGSCLSSAIVELEIIYGGAVSKERLSIRFDPLLSPGRTYESFATIKGTELGLKKGEDTDSVSLQTWRVTGTSGFQMTAMNGAVEVDPYAKYGGHAISNP
jgi:hypothetical protein